MKRGLDSLQQATMWLAQHGMQNPNDAGAAAADYLRLMGIVVVGWMWARMAKVAQAKLAADPPNAQFYKDKLMCARYWMERLIPECPMLLERISGGQRDDHGVRLNDYHERLPLSRRSTNCSSQAPWSC